MRVKASFVPEGLVAGSEGLDLGSETHLCSLAGSEPDLCVAHGPFLALLWVLLTPIK